MVAMPYKKTIKTAALALALMSSTTGAINATESADALPDELSQLIYKSALFPFYQENYFAGMTALQVAKQQNLLASNEDQADLLLGSLYLSYGMYDEAESIFLRLAEKLTDSDTSNRVWLQLAEIYFKTQSFEQAKTALERITEDLPSSLQERKTFLHGNTLLELSDHEAAVAHLSTADRNNIWYYYGLFNTGISLLNTEQKDAGYKALKHLTSATPPRKQELRTLQDKARLTLGYFELRNNKPQEAIKQFSNISLNSPYSLWGLYGLGRGAYVEEDYKNALKYWLALERHTADDVPMLEAKLAISQLYFRLGALQQSLNEFQNTIQLCEAELGKIDSTLETLNQEKTEGTFISQLLDGEIDDNKNESNYELILNRPDFTSVLASRQFDNLKQSYNELHVYKSTLVHWQRSITAFNDILTTRAKAFETKLPTIMNRHESLDIKNLKHTHSELTKLAQEISETEHAQALATDDELKLLNKLNKVASKLELLKDSMPANRHNKMLEKYRLLSGILNWNLETDFKPRLRRLNKGVQELGQLLDDTNKLESELKAAQESAPSEFSDYENRITGHANTITSLLETINQLQTAIEKEVANEFIAKLETKKENLKKLHTHARFAVAQIYDLSVTNPSSSQEEQPTPEEPATN